MIFQTAIRGNPTIVQFIAHPGIARKRPPPLVATVQRVTAEHFHLDPDLMKSQRRGTNDVAHARQIAMFLARELTHQSLPQIGRFFGNRDHTTILHAMRAVQSRICNSVKTAEDVDVIRGRLAA